MHAYCLVLIEVILMRFKYPPPSRCTEIASVSYKCVALKHIFTSAQEVENLKF